MDAKVLKSEVYFYLHLFLRKRWIIIIPSCLALIIGLYVAFTSERIFEAKTLILVEPQKVPEEFVKSVISRDLRSRVSTINQQILSRSNLEKIIEQHGLFSKPKHKLMFIEDKLYNLRRRIKVKLTSRRGTDAFVISFTGKDPKKVMNIANSLAESFINQNIKLRESEASSTDEFLNDQLQTMKLRLHEVEAELATFRSRHMGELPEQLAANISILRALRDQLSEKRNQLKHERMQILFLENDQKQNEQLLAMSDNTAESPNQEAMSLEQLNALLANLRDKYTERHPDVIRLRTSIARLESEKNQNSFPSASPKEKPSNKGQSLSLISVGSSITRFQKYEIDRLKSEIDEISHQIEIYKKRIENTPKIEEQLISLKRDYANIKDTYSSLLLRKHEAEMSVDMEKIRKGEQFRIIDHAKMPQRPISPRLHIVFILSLASGLGLGFGLVLLMEYFNDSLKKPESVSSRLGLPVLVAIPTLDQSNNLILRRINDASSIVAVIFILILTVCFASIVILDMPKSIEIVRKIHHHLDTVLLRF
jgi:polysaccharide chain length determinant protein (PEP-CTERM system associated)